MLLLLAAFGPLLFSTRGLAAEEQPSDPKKEPKSLAKTVVSDTAVPETAPDETIAAAKLAEVPGAVSLVSADVFEKGRVGTAADILAFQPGVFAQSTGGQDALRVSIRGSGINRGQGSFREGIHFLFDGLPLTGAGGSPYELFEALGVSYTEILRGGNALTYGGVALGGAINYVTKTGYDATPFEIRVELGSYGYEKAQISSGGVFGHQDYYFTVVGTHRDGFQKLTHGYSVRAIANFGFKINERTSSRLYVRFGATGFENPGNLTLKQLTENPTQANPTNVALAAGPGSKSYRRQQGSTWIASKTSIKPSPDVTADFGVVFHDYPIDIQSGTSRSLWKHDDLAFSGRYTATSNLLGQPNTFTAGFQTSTELIGNVITYTSNAKILRTQIRDYRGSGNYVLFAQDENRVAEKLWLTAAASLNYLYRQSEYTYLNNNPARPVYDRGALRLAPRLGFRYELSPDFSFFGNASRAVEPADSWKFNAVRNSAIAVQTVESWTDLKEQTSDTLELGARAQVGVFEGSLTIYRSWLKQELLTVVDPTNPTLRINTNASPTLHQGVDVGLTTILWQQNGGAKTSKKIPAHRLALRQAYTLNDFHYRNDPVFKRNELPGLPRQFYQTELTYDHPSGFYAGASTQISSRYFVDYDNSFEAPAYTIFGAKLGYAPPRAKWEIFLDFRNLTDKHYATAVTPSYTTRAVVGVGPGLDSAVFQPGDGRSVFGGITWKL